MIELILLAAGSAAFWFWLGHSNREAQPPDTSGSSEVFDADPDLLDTDPELLDDLGDADCF